MTHPFGDLSAQRKQLGQALRRLRVAAGMSGEQVAERLSMSQSRVSRIERGEQAADVAVVERWAKEARASEADLASVRELAERAATHAVSWRKALGRGGLARLQRDSQDLEATAATILNFQPVLIPGLLQTPEVARRMFAAGYPRREPEEIAAAVAARTDRQVILFDESKRFEFVIAELALRWRVGPPGVMRAQLDRITMVAALSNVTVGILPMAAELPMWHEHGFDVLTDRADADPVVILETLTDGLTISSAQAAAEYVTAFGQLKGAAVTGSDAVALVREIAASL